MRTPSNNQNLPDLSMADNASLSLLAHEPLLEPDHSRYVLFPIRYPDIRLLMPLYPRINLDSKVLRYGMPIKTHTAPCGPRTRWIFQWIATNGLRTYLKTSVAFFRPFSGFSPQQMV